MAKRSVETAWKLLVDGYLPFVRERAGRINPDLPDPPGSRPNPIPAVAVAVVSLEPGFEQTAALGVRSLQAPHPVDQHTAFPLASLSKPFASTTVALLMAERQRRQPSGETLAWPGCVPGLSIPRTLSYANLFAHRSGLPDHAGDLLEDLGFDRRTILDRLGKLALNPIDRYAYTNFGLTAAAVRADELAGEAWEDLADRLLYRKLDMRSTSSRFDVFRQRENRTWGHRRGDDGRFFTGTQRNPDAQSPAGGVTSSPHDLLAWMKLQLGDSEVLRKAGLDSFTWIEQTHRRYLPNESYGYGWNVQTDDKGRASMLSHSGAFDMGAGTSVTLWPQEKLGIVALTNAEPTGAAEALCAGFRQLLEDDRLTVEQLQSRKLPSREHPDRQLTFLANVADSMRAQLRPPRRDAGQPAPGAPFAFEGTYASDFYGEARFAVEHSSLVLYLGRKTADFDNRSVLRPTSAPNVFVYDSQGEFGARNSRVEFMRGDGTGPDRVRLWNLFATYPQSLDPPGNGVCPLDGVIRAWSVVCTEPGTVSLAMMRPGDPTTYMYPAAKVVIGTNRFADADIEVRAGDRIGFRTDRELNIHVKQPGDIVTSLDFEIDREGIFTRVRGGA
jgi:CubicO group peptidase (beta-lactamase class C family)